MLKYTMGYQERGLTVKNPEITGIGLKVVLCTNEEQNQHPRLRPYSTFNVPLKLRSQTLIATEDDKTKVVSEAKEIISHHLATHLKWDNGELVPTTPCNAHIETQNGNPKFYDVHITGNGIVLF